MSELPQAAEVEQGPEVATAGLQQHHVQQQQQQQGRWR
ncbi:Uncharacterised protein [Mycobacteroides abscessus subsp. abscessus]|nr:Uncharacterised protein [Mycobacteroides abscessus subsp. abscessus]